MQTQRFQQPPTLLQNSNTIELPAADGTFGNSIVVMTTPCLLRSLQVQLATTAPACYAMVFDASTVSAQGVPQVNGADRTKPLFRTSLLQPGDAADFMDVADAFVVGGVPLDRGLVVVASTAVLGTAAGIAAAGSALALTARVQLGPNVDEFCTHGRRCSCKR